MISMSVIHFIRCMRKEGASISAIARELGVREPTVRKYLRMVDLSAGALVRHERPSKIDRGVPLIEGLVGRGPADVVEAALYGDPYPPASGQCVRR